jgi:hypothetical protein
MCAGRRRRETVAEMTPEEKRDLIRRLAENVMGWKVRTTAAGVTFADYAHDDEDGNPRSYLLFDHSSVWYSWHPATDIRDTWTLVRALNAKHWLLSIGQLFDPGPESLWYVVTGHRYEKQNGAWYGGKGCVQENAPTLPLAICLAADAATRGDHA